MNEFLKADIFPEIPGVAIDKQIIELKCESLYQDIAGGKTDLARRMFQDMQKVTEAVVKLAYKPAEIWVMGFTCNPEVTEATLNLN